MADMTSEITELLAQAIRAIQYGHKSAAAAYLNRILEIDPDNMDAWRWLSECMPNQSKRDYCLERAGLSSAALQSTSNYSPRVSAAVSESSLIGFQPASNEGTLAEQHARRAAQRGQKRAELPPHIQSHRPVDIEFPKSSDNRKPQPTGNRKPQNLPPVVVRRPARKPAKTLRFKGLAISVLVMGVCTLIGYGLFSTGLTSGEKVWKWITLQVENNLADLDLFGEKPASSAESLYDQPAEEADSPSVLATYFPTPESENPTEPDITSEENTRVSAEVPGDEEQPAQASAEGNTPGSAEGVSPTPAITQSSEVMLSEPGMSATPETPVAAEPTGFVDGPKVIGKSVKGNDLEIVQFGNGPVERMMVAGIHGGNEWNTTALADQLTDYILDNPGVIPADRTLYILRLMNPDGEERGHNLDGRTNERGVDLNRNWDAFWEVDWPRDGCWNYRPISAGSSAFSEPEATAVRDFIQSHKISALINYHSAALGVFAGGRPPETESVRLAQSIASVTSYAYPPMDTGCKYTGQFTDWLAMNNIAAVDLELTNHTDTDFEENLAVLDVLMKWEPSTGQKSLTGLINLAQYLPQKPDTLQQIKLFGTRTWNNLNGLIFGRQEEK